MQIDRGGEVQDQEIVVIGDPESSVAIARCSSAAPASTDAGLVVRQVGFVAASTSVVLPSTQSIQVKNSTIGDLLASVQQNSTTWAVQLTQYSTTAQISSVAGRVEVGEYSTGTPVAGSSGLVVRLPAPLYDSTNNALRVFTAASSGGASSTEVTVRQSTFGDLLVKAADVSTAMAPTAGSTGLIVRFPAPIADSTESAIRVNVVAGAQIASTEFVVRQSTYTDFNTLSRLADRDASTQIAAVHNGTPASTTYGVVVRLPAPLFDSTNNALRVFQAASSGGASSTEVTVRQSTAADLQVTATQASTTWAVQLTQYSTTAQVSSVAGRVEVGEYSSAAPASNSTGLIVRIAQPSTGTFAISSIAGRTMVDQNSTTWVTQCSSLGGVVSVQQNSTTWPVQIPSTQSFQAKNSTIGDLLASVQQNSTVWQTQAALRISQTLLSTAFSTIGNNSTSSTIVSSAAGLRQKVYAYSITSTVQTVNTLSFASSLANVIWTAQMQSISSGISGANLAVSPPAWLFATEAASPLVFKITGSTGTYHLSFSYFSEA